MTAKMAASGVRGLPHMRRVVSVPRAGKGEETHVESGLAGRGAPRQSWQDRSSGIGVDW